jgi:hypothetical protein
LALEQQRMVCLVWYRHRIGLTTEGDVSCWAAAARTAIGLFETTATTMDTGQCVCLDARPLGCGRLRTRKATGVSKMRLLCLAPSCRSPQFPTFFLQPCHYARPHAHLNRAHHLPQTSHRRPKDTSHSSDPVHSTPLNLGTPHKMASPIGCWQC